MAHPNDPLRLSIDMMGGDRGLNVTANGVALALSRHPDLSCTLVGDESQIRTAMKAVIDSDRIDIVHSSESVDMHESPASALRFKKDSSMRVALNLLGSGEVDACVSAGNTGALVATARFVLKTLSEIDRPEIISTLPRTHGHVYMLDLGANIDSPADILMHARPEHARGHAVHRTWPTMPLKKPGSQTIGEERPSRGQKAPAGHASLTPKGQ